MKIEVMNWNNNIKNWKGRTDKFWAINAKERREMDKKLHITGPNFYVCAEKEILKMGSTCHD